jgi:hypothetical protein
MDMCAEPFPSKGHPCWLHNSGFESICHNMLWAGSLNLI